MLEIIQQTTPLYFNRKTIYIVKNPENILGFLFLYAQRISGILFIKKPLTF